MFGANKGLWEADEHYQRRMGRSPATPMTDNLPPTPPDAELPPPPVIPLVPEAPLAPLEPPPPTITEEEVAQAKDTLTKLAESKDPRFEEIRAVAKELAKEAAEAKPPEPPPAAPDVPDEVDRSALGAEV